MDFFASLVAQTTAILISDIMKVLFMMNNPHIFMLISKFTASNKNQINKDGFIHLYIR